MFDEHQSRPPELNIKPPLIVMACGAGGLLLSFGLCGASAALHPRAYGMPNLAMLALIVCALSILSMFAGFLWLIIAMLINAVRG